MFSENIFWKVFF